jgi:putative Mn2+ efflux pump MntP
LYYKISHQLFTFGKKYLVEYLVIFFVAIGLCFDTFAVSISSGIAKQEIIFKDALKIALLLPSFKVQCLLQDGSLVNK